MASPQKENGYTAIANEILEKLVQTPMLVSELKLVLFVIRKTYGFQKKDDIISLSQFQKGIHFSRNTIIKGLKALVKSNILVQWVALDKQKISYKFNKNWEEWILVQSTRLVQFKMSTSAVQRLKLVQSTEHTKETTKEKQKKPIATTVATPYSFEEKSHLLKSSKDERMNIIALYWEKKNLSFPSKEAYEAGLRRELRPAGELKGYGLPRITAVMDYLEKYADFKWTLETVVKYINEDLNNLILKIKGEDEFLTHLGAK